LRGAARVVRKADPECLRRLSGQGDGSLLSSSDGSHGAMQIGIIGAGHIGSRLASLWLQAGHEVMLAARDPACVQQLAARLGP